jgi:prolyl oligopeptidase
MTRKIWTVAATLRVLIGSLILGCGCAAAVDRDAPPTPARDVLDTYFDVHVDDPYRWLENADDPAVKRWTAAQDGRCRRYLDGLAVRKPILDRLWRQISKTSPSFSSLHAVGDRIFALYSQPPKQQRMIALLTREVDPARARVIVDPNAINPKGTTAIDWFVPSPDGKLIAVSLSEDGSENGTLHLFDVASRHQVGEVIPGVQYPTGGGSLAWRADSSGFWYTRYPGPDRPAAEQHFFQKVYFHRIGDKPAKDAYVLGREFPKVAEIRLDNRFNPKFLLVTVANGDGGEFEHYVIAPDGRVHHVTRFEDQVVAAAIGPDSALYLVSRKNAPHGRLLKLDLGEPTLDHARPIVPESEFVMQTGGPAGGQPLTLTAKGLYVRELDGGPSRVAVFDHEGIPQGVLPLAALATVDQVEPLGDGTLLYSISTYLRPPYFSRYDEASGTASETLLAQTSPVSYPDAVVVREFAVSKDGTKVPLTIVRRKDTVLDASHPTLLTGYGGYGVSMTPRFLGPDVRLWLDAGGVYAIANLRGGGEYGEVWHRQGSLTLKQNVFDDFAAAARYLIAQKYTSEGHLAAVGGSNGGLLVGASLTQHPELFRAVVARVGIYDMLRVELDPNGLFNTTEFGSVKNEQQFRALYAYSPYHQVTDDTRYPAVLMVAGEHDGRVNPMQSRKMVARLQAATVSGRPVLLSVNSHAGHGVDSSLSIRAGQMADAEAFLFDQLGMKMPFEVGTPLPPSADSIAPGPHAGAADKSAVRASPAQRN